MTVPRRRECCVTICGRGSELEAARTGTWQLPVLGFVQLWGQCTGLPRRSFLPFVQQRASAINSLQKPGFAAVGDAVQGAVFELDVPFLSRPALLVPPVAGKFPRTGAVTKASAQLAGEDFVGADDTTDGVAGSAEMKGDRWSMAPQGQ